MAIVYGPYRYRANEIDDLAVGDQIIHRGRPYRLARRTGWTISEGERRIPVWPAGGGPERHINVKVEEKD